MKRIASREAGTMLVYALMVLVVGAVLLAGWIHVLGTRALYTEQGIAAVKRRIVLENSRALASQYLLQNVLSGSFSTTTAYTGTLDNSWGGFTFSATNVVPLTSVAPCSAINVFSPGGNDGFNVDLAATLSDGSGSTNGSSDFGWTFKIRSRSPIFAFDLFTSQTPLQGFDIHVASNISAVGNVVLWAPNSPNTYLLSASMYQTGASSSTTLSSNSGGSLLMSDFAFLPVTTGASFTGSSSTIDPGGTGARYLASLLYKAGGPTTRSPADAFAVSVFSGTTAMVNTATTSAANGVSSDGAGTLTIDLSTQTLQKVYIMANLKKIALQGFTSSGTVTGDSLPTVLVVYEESGTSSLNTIELQNANTRRVYLGVKKATNGIVTIHPTTTGTPLAWRFAGTFENSPITFSLSSGSLQITGGLRTDQSVLLTSGTISMVRETNPIRLEDYGDRNVWLEAYKQ